VPITNFQMNHIRATPTAIQITVPILETIPTGAANAHGADGGRPTDTMDV
jgi:hypothetical protein